MERPFWLRIIGLYYLLAFAPLLCTAQPSPQFQQFSQEDGLSNNYVRTMHQDHLGFMWIGTENGLNRFDGNHFLVYRFDPDNDQSISDSWITSLLEDQATNLWVGTRQGLNRLDRATGHFERIPLRSGEGEIQNYWVNDIFEDRSRQIWICSERSGLFHLQIEEETGEYFLESLPISTKYVEEGKGPSNMIQDVHGNLWVRHSDGLDRLDSSGVQPERFIFPVNEVDKLRDSGTGKMRLDASGNILLMGNRRGLYFITPDEKQPQIRSFNQYPGRMASIPELSSVDLYTLCLQEQEQLWIGAERSIFSIDLTTKLTSPPLSEYFSFPLDVHVLLSDRDGKLWVGTAGAGFSVEVADKGPFQFLKHEPDDELSIAQGVVRSLVEDKNGHLWLGFLGEGVEQYRFALPSDLHRIRSLKHSAGNPNSLVGNYIIKILKSNDGYLWIATNGSGLNRLDPVTGSLQAFLHDPSDPQSLSQNHIWGLIEDQQGFIWVGGFDQGLNRLDPFTGQVQRFRHDPTDPNSLLDDHIKSLYVDRQGTIWIGSDIGLSSLDPGTAAFTHYTHRPDDPASISGGIVWGIYEDRHDQLWVGTGAGVNQMDRSTGTFDTFYEKDGLPSNTVYGLLEDHDGFLWVSTDNGLAIQTPDHPQNAFRAILREDGLASTSFIPKSYHYSEATGLLFFGTTEGLVVIDPKLLPRKELHPRLMLHSFSKFNPTIQAGTLTDYFISQKNRELQLSHLDRFITFALTDLVWDKNKRVRYQYQLEGFDKNWIPLEDDMEITFTNLPAGRYTLKVRSLDFFGEPQLEVDLLTIKMYPPWWQRWWAYTIYFCLFAALILFAYRILLHRQRDRQEAENLRNLNAFKDRFFANISHEFRTPLTIILGMIEQIEKNPLQRMQEGSEMIRKNGADLLNLINQILELQKLESGHLSVKKQQSDIIPFLQGISQQFQALAQSKQQQLTFQPEVESLTMDFDPEKTLRILSNLLSNAIKYTPEGGEISVMVRMTNQSELAPSPSLLLSISDTGTGISEEEIDQIFDRFFRTTSQEQQTTVGTGIGLSLTLELVKLLGGKIEVNSQLGQGTTVRVSLPVTRAAPASEGPDTLDIQSAVFSNHGTPKEEHTPTADLPVALVAEDNPDVARYLQLCLQGHYTVQWAPDGQQGINLALEQIPDIIISDVMMPGKTGFELCETLKEDTRTSHIPIILLTAKSEVEARITGLQQGADDYLAKPFHEQELLVRMENLLNIRRQLQARYQDLYAHPPAHKQSASPPSREDAFILQLKEVFEQHMDDPEFDLDAFSKALFLSRSQLGRKVKALTGQSPAVYLRSLRLQKARQLLLSTNQPIKEIAYDVGFPNPAYFSSSYSDVFGESPSKTRASREMRI